MDEEPYGECEHGEICDECEEQAEIFCACFTCQKPICGKHREGNYCLDCIHHKDEPYS